MHMLKWNVDFRWFLSLLHHNGSYIISLLALGFCVLSYFLAEMNTFSSSIDLSGVLRSPLFYEIPRSLRDGTQAFRIEFETGNAPDCRPFKSNNSLQTPSFHIRVPSTRERLFSTTKRDITLEMLPKEYHLLNNSKIQLSHFLAPRISITLRTVWYSYFLLVDTRYTQ